jgi:hypothetical protein
LPTWIQLHAHAFAFFGGVPHRVVLDNLRAGIVKACFDDPQVQSTYRECAEHYGFLLAPYRPRTPEHKGKVERGGVHYVKQNSLSGRVPTIITQANVDVRHWCLTTAGPYSASKARTTGTKLVQVGLLNSSNSLVLVWRPANRNVPVAVAFFRWKHRIHKSRLTLISILDCCDLPCWDLHATLGRGQIL